VETNEGKTFFSVVSLTHISGETKTFAQLSACLETYYADKAENDVVRQKVADISRMLQNEITKNEAKLRKLAETLEEAKDAEQYKILGELVTANIHAIAKGETQIEVINYYDEQLATIRIELDPQLTPAENAQQYFKKYNKAKNSIAY